MFWFTVRLHLEEQFVRNDDHVLDFEYIFDGRLTYIKCFHPQLINHQLHTKEQRSKH